MIARSSSRTAIETATRSTMGMVLTDLDTPTLNPAATSMFAHKDIPFKTMPANKSSSFKCYLYRVKSGTDIPDVASALDVLSTNGVYGLPAPFGLSETERDVPPFTCQIFLTKDEGGVYVVNKLVDFDQRCSSVIAPLLCPDAECLVVDHTKMGPSRSFLTNLQFIITNTGYPSIVTRTLRPVNKAGKEKVEPTE
eukprot:4446222-Amphidinium_carterae.1